MIDRARLAATDARLVIGTAVRSLASDPLLFGLQVARRLGIVPAPRRRGSGLWNALRWFLADRPEVAGELAIAATPTTALGRRLRRRLLVQLGLEPAVARDPAGLRWLDRTQRGDLSGALRHVRAGSVQARRTASELRMLAPAGPLPHHTGRPGTALFLLTNALPHTRSGYTSRSHALLTALAEEGQQLLALTRLGYPTTVGLPGTPRRQHIDGVTYERLPAAHLPLAMDERLEAQADRVAEVATREAATVLHTTTDCTNGISVRAAAARLGLPWVYEMRGQLEQSWVASRPAPLREAAASSERVQLLRAKETELARDANAVIVLSEVQRTELAARGLDERRIHVVPNGIRASLLEGHAAPAEARRRRGLPEEGFWVGSVSSLVDYEGFDTLLRAVAIARGNGVDIRCALVGAGVSGPSLRGLAEELRLGDHVVFPGRCAPEEARGWHEALDAFVVPRRDTQVTRVVTPLKIVEAMALRRPVVASALPALEELTTAPGSGVTFRADDPSDLAEVLAALAADPGRRASLAEAGHAFASGRTWQNAARTLRRIYREDCGAEVR